MKKSWKVGVPITLVVLMASAVMFATTKKAAHDPGHKGHKRAMLRLENKDPNTWNVIRDRTFGTLIYEKEGSKFGYLFFGHGLQRKTAYSLIYYADKPDRFVNWGGNYPGALIASKKTDRWGTLTMAGCIELNMDLPCPPDTNYAEGAKIWLVPSDDYNATLTKMIAWNPTEYLFETELMTYDDTDKEILRLENKNPITWEVIQDSTFGILMYSPEAPKFEYHFLAQGLTPNASYSLIYYADGWPGNHPGALIAKGTTDSHGYLGMWGSTELNMDLPNPADANYPDGAKIWLVPSDLYNEASNSIIGWSPEAYLFEYELITYHDTDVL